MGARDQSSIFSTGGKFHPDYGLLLELHALTLVAHSYALLIKLSLCYYKVATLELLICTLFFHSQFFLLASDWFQVVNHHLLKDLTELGLWDETMKHKLIAYGGSIQVRALASSRERRVGGRGDLGRREAKSHFASSFPKWSPQAVHSYCLCIHLVSFGYVGGGVWLHV